MLIMTEVKVKIVTTIGNLEECRGLETEEEMETVLLEAAVVTLEIRTTGEEEKVVPAERETTADGPEIIAQEIEAAVVANLQPGDDCQEMIS